MEDELDEAQSLAVKYVQRSPTVPIKVQWIMSATTGLIYEGLQ